MALNQVIISLQTSSAESRSHLTQLTRRLCGKPATNSMALNETIIFPQTSSAESRSHLTQLTRRLCGKPAKASIFWILNSVFYIL
jgi:uncharacterized coiled-coil protein SlyX